MPLILVIHGLSEACVIVIGLDFAYGYKTLVEGGIAALGQDSQSSECVIDSQSVRSAIPDSEKGIDGHKRNDEVTKASSI